MCLGCAERAYFNDFGKCVAVDDQCKTWDLFDGVCLSCYKGYELNKKGECVWSAFNDEGPSDLGCKTWDWDNQICLECSHRHVMTNNGCKPVSDDCADYNDQGYCEKCYKGYELNKKGECVWSAFNDEGPSDLGCKTWDWDNQICLECSHFWHMTDYGCVPNDDFCSKHASDGTCSSCYPGYILNGDVCT